MNLAIRNLVLLISVSVIASCHKKDGPDPNPNNYHLSRIVQDVASIPGGQVSVIDFVYDDQQRVDKIVFSSGDLVNGTLATTPIVTRNYYYNGAEKNPYKSTGKAPYFLAWTADVYYYYNASGQLIRDSLKSTSGLGMSVRDYSYSTDRILIKRTTYDSNGSANSPVTDTLFVKDNNLAGNRTPAYIGGGSYGNNCNYDNKPNPIAQLNIAAVQTIDGVDGFPSYLAPGFCHNNITEAMSGYTPPQGQFVAGDSSKFSYKYNAAGLPEECIITKPTYTYRIKYYYNQ